MPQDKAFRLAYNYNFDGITGSEFEVLDNVAYKPNPGRSGIERTYFDGDLNPLVGSSFDITAERVTPSPVWLSTFSYTVDSREDNAGQINYYGDRADTYNPAEMPGWSNFTLNNQLIGDPEIDRECRFLWSGSVDLIPGTYRVTNGAGFNSNFEIRDFEIRNFRLLSDRVNPESPDNNQIQIRGDFHVTPNPDESGGHAAWTPLPASWRTQIFIKGEAQDYTGTFSFTSPQSDGHVGEFVLDVDADSIDGSDVDFAVQLKLILSFPNGGQALVSTSFIRGVITRCKCDNEESLGNNRISVPLGIFSTPVGPSMAGAVANNSFDCELPPASLGYGWSSLESATVTEPVAGADLFYRDENNRLYSWINNSGQYDPRFADNKMSISKDAGSTTKRYTITYRDGRKRHFGSDNKITEEVDSNGNAVTFQHTASYFSMSDGRGRTTYYHRAAIGDQPSEVSDSATLGDTNAKRYQLTYWGPSDPAPDRLRSLIDPEGQETQYFYDSDGRLIEERQVRPVQGNRSILYTYDTRGRLATKEVFGLYRETREYGQAIDGFFGTKTTLEDITVGNTNAPRVSYQVTDKLGRTIRSYRQYSTSPEMYNVTITEYNDPNAPPPNPLPSDPNEIQESDDPYLPVRVFDPRGFKTEYFYTPRGNLKKMIDADGNGTVYKYAEQDVTSNIHSDFPDYVLEIQRSPVTVNGVLTNYPSTKLTYESTTGNLLSVEDAEGNSSSYLYNSDGQVNQVTDRRGFRTRYEYDPVNSNLVRIGVQKSLDPLDNDLVADYRYTDFDYDSYDNLDYLKSPLTPAAESTFDKVGRITQSKEPSGAITDYEYEDWVLKLTKLPPNQGSGAAIRRVVPAYDAAGRLESSSQDRAVNTLESRVEYKLDGFSQVTALTRTKNGNPEDHATAFDLLGRPVSSTDPEGRVMSYGYEPYCGIRSTTSARGVRIRTESDPLCRTKFVYAGTPGVTDLDIAEQRELREFDYDELSRLIETRQKRQPLYGIVQYGLDNYGELEEKRTYHYDSLDRLEKLVFEDLSEMLFEYDTEGNVTKVTENASSTTPVVTDYEYYGDGLLYRAIFRRAPNDMIFTYSYDDAGRLAEIEYPSVTGIKALFDDGASPLPNPGWDSNGRLTHLRYEQSGAELRRYEYTYDDAGNRITHKDIPSTGDAKLWVYGYDWFDRLTSVSVDTDPNSANLSEISAQLESVYTYDESDNRKTFKLEQLNELLTYEYNKADELVEIKQKIGTNPEMTLETFSFDTDGNMTDRVKGGVTTTYTWDDFSRLVYLASSDANKKQRHTYAMNGFRRKKRDKTSVDTTEYALGLETAVSKSSSESVTYLMGHQLMGFEKSGAMHFFLHDGLFTVREVIAENSGAWEIRASYEFSEYGEKISASNVNGIESQKTFVGGLSVQDEVPDTELMLMGHRYYEPSLGRFLNRDPIGFAGGLNLFSYSRNSPVTHTDHTGLNPFSGMMERTYGPIKIVGGSKSAVLCVKKILHAINQTKTGRQLLGELSERGTAEIRLGNHPPETDHGGKFINFPSSSELLHSHGASTLVTEAGLTKASPLRSIAHELSHLARCRDDDNQCRSLGRPCADEEKTQEFENSIVKELGLPKRRYLTDGQRDAIKQTSLYGNAPIEYGGNGLDCL